MPWCETCSRFWNPPSLEAGGTCPTCGRVLALPDSDGGGVAEGDGHAQPWEGDDPAAGEEDPEREVPWHFKLLLVAMVVYLGFRAYQGVVWLAHRF